MAILGIIYPSGIGSLDEGSVQKIAKCFTHTRYFSEHEELARLSFQSED